MENKRTPNFEKMSKKSVASSEAPHFLDQNSGRHPKVFLKTFGCQMNDYDSGVALGILKAAGYELAKSEGDADVIVFNTCSVREHAEERVFGRLYALKELKAERPNLVLGMMGCMVEEHREKLFQKFPHLDLMVGTRNVKELPELIRQVLSKRHQIAAITQEGLGIEYSDLTLTRSPIHGYLPIMTGCNKNCTYCIVPVTRGSEISVDCGKVFEEAKRLALTGIKHLTLLGQNVNSYGKNSLDGVTFAELLRRINDIPGLERISFTTSHPEDATEELFMAIRDSKKVSRHFHLPLQSGSNAVLKRMKRGHTIEEFIEKTDRLRLLVPEISFTTDIIVGFPGENDEDYEATKRALERIRFDGAFIFKYSERSGTPAARLTDDVPLEEKKRRNNELLGLQDRLMRENNLALIGRKEEVLVECRSTKDPEELLARNQQEKKIVFRGEMSMIGKLVEVKLEELLGDTFRGRLYVA